MAPAAVTSASAAAPVSMSPCAPSNNRRRSRMSPSAPAGSTSRKDRQARRGLHERHEQRAAAKVAHEPLRADDCAHVPVFETNAAIHSQRNVAERSGPIAPRPGRRSAQAGVRRQRSGAAVGRVGELRRGRRPVLGHGAPPTAVDSATPRSAQVIAGRAGALLSSSAEVVIAASLFPSGSADDSRGRPVDPVRQTGRRPPGGLGGQLAGPRSAAESASALSQSVRDSVASPAARDVHIEVAGARDHPEPRRLPSLVAGPHCQCDRSVRRLRHACSYT